MKAILVVDMPTTCEECELDKLYNDIYIYCKHSSGEGKNPSCPLKPFPLKGTMENVIDCEYNRGFVDGRNHCIDDIIGETE